MRYELVKDRDEALNLLEADLITIQCFIDICHINGWPLTDFARKNGESICISPENLATALEYPAPRLIYSKD